MGSTPLTSSDLGPLLGIPYHVAANLNDGLYGNAHSWISANGIGGNTDPSPSAGIVFNGLVQVSNLAWSRDNGDAAEGNVTDRTLGTYTLQVTTVASPDATTPDTGDAATGWTTIGTVTYSGANADFTPHLRHRFDVSAGGQHIEATALRIKTPDGFTDIDEIEVNTATGPAAPQLSIARSGANATITWSGGGGLQSAPTVNGPWECIQDALPTGYTVPLNTAAKTFYRVQR